MKYPRFLAPYKPVLFFAMWSFVLLSASRGLLVIWQWARVDSVDGLATVMLQGVRSTGLTRFTEPDLMSQ